MAITAGQHRGRACAGKQDARRFPRQVVSWLVTVSIGSRQLKGRTKDTSAAGAKSSSMSDCLSAVRYSSSSGERAIRLSRRMPLSGDSTPMDSPVCSWVLRGQGSWRPWLRRVRRPRWFARMRSGPGVDLFLVDVELRLMNGERLVQQLVPHRPAAKVLLISQGSVPRPTVPGASWLPTPCSREDLAMGVHQALETKT